jgi:hypothetical protein
MALSPEDVAALGQLLDQRLEAHGKLIDQKLEERERRQRNRRRFWLWFWILVFVGSSVASWWTVRSLLGKFQDQMAALETDTIEAKLAYQQQLAHDRQMQRERAAVQQATGYRSEQSQAEFDAGLVRQAFQLLGRSAEMRARAQKPAETTTDDDMDQALKDVGDMTAQMSDMLGKLLLHETDPAHNSRAERLATSGEAATPRTADPVNEQLARPADRPAP